MYFSGPWQGYWEQGRYGRQPMLELKLSFAKGVIRGSGKDIVGRFTFLGSYNQTTGTVVMTKQYRGAHAVEYRGQYDGEGTIFGRWSIGPNLSGPFALAPRCGTVDPDVPIQDL
jgi:hypothetical protein